MMLLNPTDTALQRRMIRRYPDHFGYLVTPRKRGIPSFISQQLAPWAADNDAFSGTFDPDRFFPWLESLSAWKSTCLFVTIPDQVGDAGATLDLFERWSPEVRALGYPLALAIQDNIRSAQIPWTAIDAVFLGGSTPWILSGAALDLLREAKDRGKWTHAGRVNSQKRVQHFWHYALSFDGTGFAIAPDAKIREFLPLFRRLAAQRRLPCTP